MQPYFEDIERLALAALLGAIVGLERELQGKEAGLRTIMLVSLGAALFTIVSYRMSYILTGRLEDYARIASYIVSGIGFLCAGLIFRSGSGIQGLTTAATVWAVTAIGMATGIGMYAVALAATGICIIILLLINYLELQLEKVKLKRTYLIKTKEDISETTLLQHYFTEEKMALLNTKSMRENELNEFHITVRGPKAIHHNIVKNLLDNNNITELKY